MICGVVVVVFIIPFFNNIRNVPCKRVLLFAFERLPWSLHVHFLCLLHNNVIDKRCKKCWDMYFFVCLLFADIFTLTILLYVSLLYKSQLLMGNLSESIYKGTQIIIKGMKYYNSSNNSEFRQYPSHRIKQ